MFSWLKFLWKIKEPATEVVGEMKEFKRGWKTFAFWISLIGNLATIAGASAGYIPPESALIINTILATVYNILRGVAKSEEEGVRPWYVTTESWLSIGTQLNNGILTLQHGGINPQWLVVSGIIINGITAMVRDLAHQQPNGQQSTAPTTNAPTGK